MEQILQKIKELADLVYSKEKHWDVKEMELMPPADDAAIKKISAELPFPLPPSYAEFLKLHDGCLNFWVKFSLLGTKGKPFEIMQAGIKDARNWQSQVVSEKENLDSEQTIPEKITPELTKKYENSTYYSKQRFYLPNHIVFGTNLGGEFYMFNENKKTLNDEYEVIHYTYSGGAYYRYNDFLDFLEKTLQGLEKRVKDKKYKL